MVVEHGRHGRRREGCRMHCELLVPPNALIQRLDPSPSSLHGACRDKNAIHARAARRFGQFGRCGG
jgi:hypothetical protein